MGGGGATERPCFHIHGERYLASSSSLPKNTLGSVPHVSTHVQTQIRTHTCVPHTCARRGDGERDSLLTLWCFLGLDFNQTKSLLLLCLLCNYSQTQKRVHPPPERPENKLSHQGLFLGQGHMVVWSGGPCTWCWICPQEKWDSIKCVFQVPLSHPGLASRSRGSSCTAPVQLWALNRRKANKGSMPSHTLTFQGNK